MPRRLAPTARRQILGGQQPSGFALGTLNLGATYHTIDIEQHFTESVANSVARAVASIQPSDLSSPAWITEDLYVTRPSDIGPVIYGVGFGCTAGTAYNVVISLIDTGGGIAQSASTVTTRTDAIPAASSLTPTHYVRAAGSDAADGLTAGTAWATLDHAWTQLLTTADAVLQVGPGIFSKTADQSSAASQKTSTTATITVVAQFPALNDSLARINAGNETFIVQPAALRSSPTASGGPNPGVWTSETVVGPGIAGAPAATNYQIWKFATGQTIASTSRWLMQVSATETGEMRQICPWRNDLIDLDAVESAVEKIYTNGRYRYGFWVDGTPGNVYVRLPNDVDPNTLWISITPATGSIGTSAPFAVRAPNCRFSGLVIRGFLTGVAFGSTTSRGGIGDHCAMESVVYGVNVGSGTAPTSATAGNNVDDVTVEYCTFTERGLRALSGGVPDATIIPWNMVKIQTLNADGTTYATDKIAGVLEGTSVYSRNGGRRMVQRHCLIDGVFNGVGLGFPDAASRYTTYGWEWHDLLIRDIADDAIEPDLSCCNVKAYDIRVEYALVGISLSPIVVGPFYAHRCVFWRFGADGLPMALLTGTPEINGEFVKFGASATNPVRGKMYGRHLTAWSDLDQSYTDGGGYQQYRTHAAAPFAGATSNDPIVHFTNCVIRATAEHYHTRNTNRVENYNLIATESYIDNGGNLRGGIRFDSGTIKSYTGTLANDTIANYRSERGYGAQTNKVDGVDQQFTPTTWLDALLTDPENGDLSLTVAAQSQVVGVVLPGINDDLGRTPRMGYQP
jgi:hypothetical protein